MNNTDSRGDVFMPGAWGIDWNGDIMSPAHDRRLPVNAGLYFYKGDRYACVRFSVPDACVMRPIAALVWDTRTGIIEQVTVRPEYRRQGIARSLLAMARLVGGTIRHSDNLTPDGRAWRDAM